MLNDIDQSQQILHNIFFENAFSKNIVNNKIGNHKYDKNN